MTYSDFEIWMHLNKIDYPIRKKLVGYFEHGFACVYERMISRAHKGRMNEDTLRNLREAMECIEEALDPDKKVIVAYLLENQYFVSEYFFGVSRPKIEHDLCSSSAEDYNLIMSSFYNSTDVRMTSRITHTNSLTERAIMDIGTADKKTTFGYCLIDLELSEKKKAQIMEPVLDDLRLFFL